MTVAEALSEGVKALRYLQLPSADLDAAVLLAHVLHATKEELVTRGDRVMGDTSLAHYQALVLRRGRREPVAYLVGTKEFFGLPFFVDRNVLIPRPETESLVELVLAALPHDTEKTIADIGTGSGCIAVTLAKHLRGAHLFASDVSEDALEVARRNAEHHRVGSRIGFLHGSLLTPYARRHLDIVVANLPYVPDREVVANPDLAFEPLLALRGQLGPDRTLAQFLKEWYDRDQRPNLFLEIHPNQAEILMKENEKIGVTVTIMPDLAGTSRFALLASKY